MGTDVVSDFHAIFRSFLIYFMKTLTDTDIEKNTDTIYDRFLYRFVNLYTQKY